MTIEQLDKVHKAKKFRPFYLRTADGRIVPVSRRENLWRTQGGAFVIVNPRGEHVEMIETSSITTIEFSKASSRGKRRK